MAESESQGLVASRPLTTTTSSSSSRCIRIHTGVDNDNSNDIPIWALIEVNGELLEPKNDENAGDIDETTTTTLAEERRIRMDPDYRELGAVHFVDQQVGTARGSL